MLDLQSRCSDEFGERIGSGIDMVLAGVGVDTVGAESACIVRAEVGYLEDQKPPGTDEVRELAEQGRRVWDWW